MSESNPTWVIIGCGYTGRHLAVRLKEMGFPVIGTSRTVQTVRDMGVKLGIGAHQVDVYDPKTLADWIPEDSIVVDSVPSDLAQGPHTQNVVIAAAKASARRVLYLSSTGVYPFGNGEWVDEMTPANPESARGRARLAEEQSLVQAGLENRIDALILRIPAIYGPRRGVVARMQAGTYKLVENNETYTSRIHVIDLVEMIRKAGLVSPLIRNCYTLSDDEPTTSRAYAEEVSRLLGFPVPESVPLDSLAPDHQALVKANRRVSNARAKQELGVSLKYPTWREGARSCLQMNG